MADSISQEAINGFPEIAPFDPTKKKKKKKQKNTDVTQPQIDYSLHGLVEREDMLSYGGEGVVEDDELVHQSRYLFEGNESDYQYKELLRRIFSFLHGKNPELSGDRRRTVLRPPQILQEGTTQTIVVNFADLCKLMYRPLEHVTGFMLKELGKVGSLDGENKLVVKGSFPSSSFENLLQTYISEYVLCSCCKSPDTILSEDSHILLLQCNMCGTERTVAHIDASCSTRVERRKAGK